MTTPTWSPVDDETADLLALVAMGSSTGEADREWDFFREALGLVADALMRIDPNRLREKLRGHVKPQRVGAFVNRALPQGLIAYTGEWVTSTDAAGRNSGKPCRQLELAGMTRDGRVSRTGDGR